MAPTANIAWPTILTIRHESTSIQLRLRSARGSLVNRPLIYELGECADGSWMQLLDLEMNELFSWLYDQETRSRTSGKRTVSLLPFTESSLSQDTPGMDGALVLMLTSPDSSHSSGVNLQKLLIPASEVQGMRIILSTFTAVMRCTMTEYWSCSDITKAVQRICRPWFARGDPIPNPPQIDPDLIMILARLSLLLGKDLNPCYLTSNLLPGPCPVRGMEPHRIKVPEIDFLSRYFGYYRFSDLVVLVGVVKENMRDAQTMIPAEGQKQAATTERAQSP